MPLFVLASVFVFALGFALGVMSIFLIMAKPDDEL